MNEPGENLMLRDYWYPACASSRLAAQPVASRVLDQEIVLFRDEAGAAHALLDRCCHRGVKLSLGKSTRGCVACPYHGWEYDGAGTCVHVPSLAEGREIPKASQSRVFPALNRTVMFGFGWPTAIRIQSNRIPFPL
jgi:phenylpropionate dioxygenase-like ring-hydroxylating dioxygenase large terminal subunit